MLELNETEDIINFDEKHSWDLYLIYPDGDEKYLSRYFDKSVNEILISLAEEDNVSVDDIEVHQFEGINNWHMLYIPSQTSDDNEEEDVYRLQLFQ